jgi:hypothetical protein
MILNGEVEKSTKLKQEFIESQVLRNRVESQQEEIETLQNLNIKLERDMIYSFKEFTDTDIKQEVKDNFGADLNSEINEDRATETRISHCK